jgi:hypothetical protein
MKDDISLPPGFEEPEGSLTIADLYPNLPPKDQAEAEYNLKRYAALAWRIHRRIQREGGEI